MLWKLDDIEGWDGLTETSTGLISTSCINFCRGLAQMNLYRINVAARIMEV